MKKFLSLLLCFLCVLLLLTGCQTTGETVTGSVVITTVDGEEILNTPITLNGKNATALEAITKVCQDNDIPYTLKNGMLDNFGNLASTATDGWLLYYNGELAQVGAKSIPLTEGFLIEVRYLNYDEYFTL